MDPKILANLDPKLRETYERVMGTPSPAPSTESANMASSSVLDDIPSPVKMSSTITDTPTPSPSLVFNDTVSMPPVSPLDTPVVLPIQPPQSSSVETHNSPLSLGTSSPQTIKLDSPTPATSTTAPLIEPIPLTPLSIKTQPTQADKVPRSSGIVPILFVVAGLVFFALYTLFWIKFFNISIPFLSI